jgi:hypothetical protein
MLRRRPGMAAAACVALAVGIAANAVIFSIAGTVASGL